MKNFLLQVFCFLIFIPKIHSQNSYPQSYFRNPLDIPMILAGTFGELRTAHFHSGIDIKTQNTEGLKIHTAAEGYVSRIKVSLWGYGKTLYITHPNGYTTVYAHLKKFNPTIEAFVKKQQYKKESFEIQLFPNKDALKVTKDEVIAFSGNTGSSSAPHLHFEIRNTKTEKIINPMHFGLIPNDTKKPKILNLRAYPVGDSSVVNKSNIPIPIDFTETKSGIYQANEIEAYGKIGLAINTYDRQDGALNKNGVYKIEMFVNGKSIYQHKLETFSFSESKLINLLIDYPFYYTHKRKYQKTHIHPESNLSIYQNTQEKGYISVLDKMNYQVTIQISDFVGNISTLNIPIKGNQTVPTITKKPEATPYFINRKKDTLIKLKTVTVNFPKQTFYDNVYLDLFMKDSVLNVHKPNIPLNKSYSITFDVKKYTEAQKQQMYIASITNNKYYTYVSTVKKDSLFKTSTKTLGKFTLNTDKQSPVIKNTNISEGQKISKYRYLTTAISDKQTGIKSFRGEIDGEWILMEYNTKKGVLTYDFNDKKLSKGKHTFQLTVKDNVENTSTFSRTFYIN